MQAGQTRRPTRWGPMTITWCLHQTKCIGLEEAWVDKFCPDMLESKQTSFGCSNRNYVEKDENLDLPEGISQTKGHHSSQRDFQRTNLIDWFLYGPLLLCKWLKIANYNIRRWKDCREKGPDAARRVDADPISSGATWWFPSCCQAANQQSCTWMDNEHCICSDSKHRAHSS